MAKLRAGVIGVGHLGRHHARLYAALPDSTLVGVLDHDQERGSLIGRKYGAQTFSDLPDLLKTGRCRKCCRPHLGPLFCGQSLSRSREACAGREADRCATDRGSGAGGVGQAQSMHVASRAQRAVQSYHADDAAVHSTADVVRKPANGRLQ